MLLTRHVDQTSGARTQADWCREHSGNPALQFCVACSAQGRAIKPTTGWPRSCGQGAAKEPGDAGEKVGVLLVGGEQLEPAHARAGARTDRESCCWQGRCIITHAAKGRSRPFSTDILRL